MLKNTNEESKQLILIKTLSTQDVLRWQNGKQRYKNIQYIYIFCILNQNDVSTLFDADGESYY